MSEAKDLFYAYTRNRSVLLTDPSGYKGGCPPQSPNCVPTDPDAPYQDSDGLWYNTLDWNGQLDPTPPLPDNGPSPPPSPQKPGPQCECEHGYTYYAVRAEVESEYDWERVKVLARMFGLSGGLNGLEHHLARELWRDMTKGIDVYLIYTDIEDLEKIDREAQEEIEKRLNCKD